MTDDYLPRRGSWSSPAREDRPEAESVLRWERPRIVSTRPTAAGTPRPEPEPNGWEA